MFQNKNFGSVSDQHANRYATLHQRVNPSLFATTQTQAMPCIVDPRLQTSVIPGRKPDSEP